MSRGCARTTASRRGVTDPWVEEHGGLKERGKETKLDISLSCASLPRVQQKKKGKNPADRQWDQNQGYQPSTGSSQCDKMVGSWCL